MIPNRSSFRVNLVLTSEQSIKCKHFFSGALFLSLKYEFVTPLTSLVVSVPEATKEGTLSEAIGGHNRRHTITFSSAYSFADGTLHLLCLIVAFLIVFQ